MVNGNKHTHTHTHTHTHARTHTHIEEANLVGVAGWYQFVKQIPSKSEHHANFIKTFALCSAK